MIYFHMMLILVVAVDQIGFSAEIIKQGQEQGVIRSGDARSLSSAFWCSVQGIMEQHLITPEIPLPETEWITAILKK